MSPTRIMGVPPSHGSQLEDRLLMEEASLASTLGLQFEADVRTHEPKYSLTNTPNQLKSPLEQLRYRSIGISGRSQIGSQYSLQISILSLLSARYRISFGNRIKFGSGLHPNPSLNKFVFPLYFFSEGSSFGIKRGGINLSFRNL